MARTKQTPRKPMAGKGGTKTKGKGGSPGGGQQIQRGGRNNNNNNNNQNQNTSKPSKRHIHLLDDIDDDILQEPKPSKRAKTSQKMDAEELEDGDSFDVPHSEYIIRNVGGDYYCTCPAWRYQSKKIDARTCKHLKQFFSKASARQEAIGREDDDISSIHAASSPPLAIRTVSPTPESPTTSPKSSSTSSHKKTQDRGSLFLASNLMLAHNWNAEQHQPEEFLMSEKLDGMRALWNGRQLVSRQGNVIDAPAFFVEGFPHDLALDGELFCGRGEFQRTVSIARRKNGGNQWRSLRFVVFDAPSIDAGFEERLAIAEAMVGHLEFVKIHSHQACRDLNHLAAELKRIEDLGGEGLMMRKKNSSYKHGRSKDLLKVKTFVDDDALVRAHQAGKGRHRGRMGALMCRLRDGTEFKVGSGFSDNERERPPAVGSVISFRYFERTKAGVPRFPVYLRLRPDVDASEFS
mmetsp:Transcript_30455/g.46638  ORF Transcript_30455/g.46638 Transcript_30455/m.46638 type:complete len:463 (-) Transcript_30455:8-1396(-)